jgi:hypothetical protein
MKTTFEVYWIYQERIQANNEVIVSAIFRLMGNPFSSMEDAIKSVDVLTNDHPEEKFTIMPIYGKSRDSK